MDGGGGWEEFLEEGGEGEDFDGVVEEFREFEEELELVVEYVELEELGNFLITIGRCTVDSGLTIISFFVYFCTFFDEEFDNF